MDLSTDTIADITFRQVRNETLRAMRSVWEARGWTL